MARLSSSALRASGRRGSAVVFVLVLGVLLAMVALVVDLGFQQVARVELQAGVDAATLAGAGRLDRTELGVWTARETVLDYARRNEVLGAPIELDPSAVLFGTWDSERGVFVPEDDPALIDAVQVHAAQSFPTTFAGVAFGILEVGVAARSTVVRPLAPAAELDCFLPIALPACTWEAMLESGDQGDHHFVFSADQVDNVGWAHPVSPTPSTIEQELQALVDGSCEDGLDAFAVGDPIGLNNGVQRSTLRMLGDALEASTDPWRDDLWGAKPGADPSSVFAPAAYPGLNVLQGPVAIFDDGGAACTSVQYNQSPSTTAFAWGVIFDVFDGGGQHAGFQLYVDTDHAWEPSGGGGYGEGNVQALQAPVLVGEEG